MAPRISASLAILASLVLLSSLAQVQAKTIMVGGPFRFSPWGPLTIKWKCPPIQTGDKLVFVWRQLSSIVQFVPSVPADMIQAKYWNTCKTKLATNKLVKASKSGRYTYTVKSTDYLNLMFASGVGNMCKRGQRFQSPAPKCDSTSNCFGA